MKNKTLTLLAGLLLSLPALAEDGKLVLSGGILNPHGDALDLTQQTMRGWGFTAGYEFQPEGYGTRFLAYVGHMKMPGKKNVTDRKVYDLAANVVGLDLIYTPFESLKALSLFGGPSVHQWQVEEKGLQGFAGQGQQDWRLGWRAGVGYELNPTWRFTAAFTQTEWRSTTSIDYTPGLNPSRPAYVSLMAHYRF